MSDLADRLEQDLAPAWRPDQDDEKILIGDVVSVDWGTSEFGPYPLLVIRQDDGTEKAVHAFHTVLRNELSRVKPQPGEKIGIKYLGKQNAAEGSKYGSYIGYKVRVDRPLAAFNWDQAAAEEMVELVPPQEPVTVPAEAGNDDIPFS